MSGTRWQLLPIRGPVSYRFVAFTPILLHLKCMQRIMHHDWRYSLKWDLNGRDREFDSYQRII